MAQVIQVLAAATVLVAFVWAIWSISQRLTSKGIIVRPVSFMDAKMTEIERRYAERSAPKDVTAEE